MYMNVCVYMYKMEIRFTKLKFLHDEQCTLIFPISFSFAFFFKKG